MNFEKLLGKINRTLREQRAEFKVKDLEIQADQELQDDTEYMYDFHNQAGYIDGLEYVVGLIQHDLGKKKKKS